MTDTQSAIQKWRQIAKNWKSIGPTAKPGLEEIALYRAITTLELADKEGANIVILGSTPELRDMCASFPKNKIATVTCVDVTEDMYQAMSQLVARKNPKEKYVHGSWLDMAKMFKKGSIDMVYGDHVVSNVGGKEDEFFSVIKAILRDDGCFASKIQHVDVSDPIIAPISAYDKLKDYAEKYRSGKMDLKAAFTHFGMNLLFASYHLNSKNEMSFLYWKDQIDQLDGLVNKNGDKYEKSILNKCKKIWWNWRDITWTQYEKSVMRKMIDRHFFIKDEMRAPGHEFSRQTSIYRLKKR